MYTVFRNLILLLHEARLHSEHVKYTPRLTCVPHSWYVVRSRRELIELHATVSGKSLYTKARGCVRVIAECRRQVGGPSTASSFVSTSVCLSVSQLRRVSP